MPYFSLKHVFLILHSYNRRRELIRLCRWAKRKRLSHPLRLYRFRLQDEEIRLSSYELRYPQSANFAHCIHILNALLFGEPRSIRKGIGDTIEAGKHELHKPPYRESKVQGYFPDE